MTVRELLEQARDAVLQKRIHEESLERLRSDIGVQGHTYGFHAKNGILDPMRKVDDLIEAENTSFDIAGFNDSIEEARIIVTGIATIADSLTVQVIENYYLDAKSWSEVAYMAKDWSAQLHCMSNGKRAASLQAANDELMKQYNGIGIARLKELAQNG